MLKKPALREQQPIKTTANIFNKKTFKSVFKYLRQQAGVMKCQPAYLIKQNCKIENSKENRTDQQIKLRCRQLPNVIQELRKTLIKQNFEESAALLTILCHPGLKLYDSFILKVCFFLMFGHPKSSFTLVQNFIRRATGYILEEDVNKFIKILFCLRKSALRPLQSGKYIRKSGDYKLSRDIEFENIQ